MTEIQNVVPEEAKHCLLSPMEVLEDLDYFPEFGVRPAIREWEEGQGLLLTFKNTTIVNPQQCQQEGTLSGVCEGEASPGPLRCRRVEVVGVFWISFLPQRQLAISLQAPNSKENG